MRLEEPFSPLAGPSGADIPAATEREQPLDAGAELDLRRLAHRDPLTGLHKLA